MKFRYDIQGIRAIAVLTVFVFHLGFLPNGYLGVDIFFVISGFLITGILNKEFINETYSIKEFYLRRLRRIIPLVLIVNIIALIIGFIIMLPDDYENLAQSVVATNFFSNNILQYITTGNYWDVVNDYKPLMHTWSLGVEEQYYLLFPVIFLFLTKRKNKLFTILLVLTCISLLSFIFTKNEAGAFYLLHNRFFEISVGGLATLKQQEIKSNKNVANISLLLLFIIIFLDFGLSNQIKVVLTVALTCLLILHNTTDSLSNKILSFKPIVFLGTISFSIYMWHQLVFATYRYLFGLEMNFIAGVLFFVIILILSVLSYYFVEDYFRNSKKVSTKNVLIFTISLFLITTIVSLFIYIKGGIVKDFPILNITTQNAKRGINSEYNDRIYKLSGNFNTSKTKVLIIGDSFGRDWGNILLESNYKNNVEVKYCFDINNTENANKLVNDADIIFISYLHEYAYSDYLKFIRAYHPKVRVYIIGTKNFGDNSGVFYNNIKGNNYCAQRTNVQKEIIDINNRMKIKYKNSYIDIIGSMQDTNNTLPVFTDDCKLISQDTRHLTKSGAIYIGKQINLQKYLEK